MLDICRKDDFIPNVNISEIFFEQFANISVVCIFPRLFYAFLRCIIYLIVAVEREVKKHVEILFFNSKMFVLVCRSDRKNAADSKERNLYRAGMS